jgi:hypothetical protein
VGGEGGAGGASASSSGQGGEGGQGGVGSGGAGGCLEQSPSGYLCDPWSVHLYVGQQFSKIGNSLRVRLSHDPDNEGGPNDSMIPIEHQYWQLLTVDIDLTPEVRNFVCVVFTATQAVPPQDASSPSFQTDVQTGGYSIATSPTNGFDLPSLEAICNGSLLSPVVAPAIAMTKPQLPDLAMMIPLLPTPTTFGVGESFTGHLARGRLFVDEQAELSPEVTATVVEVMQ